MAGAYAQFRGDISIRFDSASSAAFAELQNRSRIAGAGAERSIDRVSRSASGMENNIRGAAAAFGAFQGYGGAAASRLNATANAFQALGSSIGLFIGVAAGASGFISLTNNIQNYQARLQAASKDQNEFASSYALLQNVSKETRSDLGETIAFYTRLKIATDTLGLSQQDLGGIITTVQKSIRLSGAGTQEASAALTQFVQGISSANGLSGDEFKSLGENATKVLKAIADGLKETGSIPGFDGTLSSLRQLGKEGKLTADVVVPALQRISGSVDTEFSKLPITVQQSTVLLQNALTDLVVKGEQATGVLAGTAGAIKGLSENFGLLVVAAATVGTVIAARVLPGLLATSAAFSALRAAVSLTSAVITGTTTATVAGALAMTRLRAAAAAAVAFFGKPWGIALAVAAGAVVFFSTRMSAAEEVSNKLGISQNDLATRIDKVTGALGRQAAAYKGTGLARERIATENLGTTRTANIAAKDNLLGLLGSTPGANSAGSRDQFRAAIGSIRQNGSIESISDSVERLRSAFPKGFGQNAAAINGAVRDLAARAIEFKAANDEFLEASAEAINLKGSLAKAAPGGKPGKPDKPLTIANIAALAASSLAEEGTREKLLADFRVKTQEIEQARAAGKISDKEAIEQSKQALQVKLQGLEAIKAQTVATKDAVKAESDSEKASLKAAEARRKLAQETAEYFAAVKAPGIGDLRGGEGRDALGQSADAIAERLAAGGTKLGDTAAERLASRADAIGQAIGGAFGRSLRSSSGIARLLNELNPGQGDLFNTASQGVLKGVFDFGSDQLGGLLKKLNINLGDLSSTLGKAAGGAAVGSLIGSGLGLNQQGSQLGGALGAAFEKPLSKGLEAISKGLGQFAGPAGAIIGSIVGGLASKLAKGVTPRAFATLSTGASGQGQIGGVLARGAGSAENSAGARTIGNSVIDGLAALASQLNGSVQANANLGSIGPANGKFEFKSGTVGAGGYGGGQTQVFASAEEAVAAAIFNAVNKGIITGLRDSTRRILQAGNDLQAQAAKAAKFEGVFTDLQKILDPVGAAVGDINKRFRELQGIFTEAGASADELGKLQQLYDIQRKDALDSANTELKDFLNSLTTDSSFGLSARDRQGAAAATFAGFRTDILAGKSVDQGAFTAAGQALLAVNRELYGSQQEYFASLTEVTDLTKKAISDAGNVTSIADALTLSVQPVTAGITALQQALLSQGADTNALLSQLVASGAANNNSYGGGFAGAFDSRNF